MYGNLRESMISLSRVTGKHKDFIQLVNMLDADLDGRYGDLQDQYDQYNTIEQLATVIVAYYDDQPIGCGAMKPYEMDAVEIKRMYVHPDSRGQGIAGRILNELEGWAKELGYTRAVLETGVKQAEAIGLYQKHGYQRIENYGQYRDMPSSVCFAKPLR